MQNITKIPCSSFCPALYGLKNGTCACLLGLDIKSSVRSSGVNINYTHEEACQEPKNQEQFKNMLVSAVKQKLDLQA